MNLVPAYYDIKLNQYFLQKGSEVRLIDYCPIFYLNGRWAGVWK